MKGESWNLYLLFSDQSLSLNLLVIVFYKVKIFHIFVIFWFYIVAWISWKWKRAPTKGYYGVFQLLKDNMNISQDFRITIPFPFWKLKAFTPTPHASYIREWIIVAHTTALSQNDIWHVYFFFYVKIFMQSTFIYTINLLNPYLFQSSNDTSCPVGLKHQMKSIFKPKEHLNCFVQFMLLLAQSMIFELSQCHKYLIALFWQLRWTSKFCFSLIRFRISLHVLLYRLSHLYCHSCICCFVIRSTTTLFCSESLPYQVCN